MRVFVAGASGVLGLQLLPMLAAHGHQVVGMARHTSAEVGSNPNVELVTATLWIVSGRVRRTPCRARRNRQPADRDPGGS